MASRAGEDGPSAVTEGAGAGGAVRPNDTSSASRTAGLSPAGRSMIRNCALRASPGARIAPVVTGAKESLTPGSSLESAVESCAPLASSEAYQATRMRARATSETGRSRPAASYQRPPSTVTAWCSQAVAAPREVREADRELPSDATRASPACVRQP